MKLLFSLNTLDVMKSALFLFLLFSPYWIQCQSDSLIRTDGIYIFDNNIETFYDDGNYGRGLKAQYMFVATGSVSSDLPCGSGNAISIDITLNPFLSFLVFFSDSTGRTMTIGSCRDEQNIRNKALSCLVQKSTITQPKYSNDHCLDNMQLFQDSAISFNDSLGLAFNSRFKGKAYGDSIVVVMERSVAKCDQVYREKRKYLFYSYSQIFNCDWIYLKPE